MSFGVFGLWDFEFGDEVLSFFRGRLDGDVACISFLVDFIDLKRDCTGVIVDVREIFGESILQESTRNR